MKKLLILLYCLFASSNAFTNPKNVLKLTCEFDPNLIKKELNDIGFVENDKIDNQQICKTLVAKILLK